MADGCLRLDKFLWYARLAKTRGTAQATVEAGHLRIDGRPVARAHAPVRIGNVLTFALYDRIRVIRVEALPGRRGPAVEARSCYTDLAPATPVVPLSSGSDNVSQPPAYVDAPDGPT